MKNLLAVVVVVSLSGMVQASFVPASVTKQNQASSIIDIRENVARQIKARAEAGYHYASVDMDGASWKTMKEIMTELESLGYTVHYGNDHHVYGWNNLNGALVIRW
jgi:hypothetical protein